MAFTTHKVLCQITWLYYLKNPCLCLYSLYQSKPHESLRGSQREYKQAVVTESLDGPELQETKRKKSLTFLFVYATCSNYALMKVELFSIAKCKELL